MDKKYTYLKSDCKEAQWLADAHAAGFLGVLCRVWDDDISYIRKEFITHQADGMYIDSNGWYWKHAELIVTEQPEDPRIAALQAGVVVTIDNAVVGAEVVSMAWGKLKIHKIENSSIYAKNDKVSDMWLCNGKLYSNSQSDLYYAAGKVPGREPECEVVKFKARPFTGESGYQCVALGPLIEEYRKDEPDYAGWNGPEQEIEIKIYNPGKK